MELYQSIIVQAVITSLITTIMVFLSLRWILPRVGEELADAISPLTTIGARMAGEKSGQSRKQKAIVNNMAQGFLSSPKMIGLKLVGKQLGFDLDAMVEEHGAVETMQGLSQLAALVGIDITQFVSGNIGLPAQKPSQLGLKA
jgi:hypothetical protein